MRVAGLVAMLLMALAGAAQAQAREDRDWLRTARNWAELLLGEPLRDDEVIAPPAGIDPQMVVEPPRPRGALRVIPPPSRPGR